MTLLLIVLYIDVEWLMPLGPSFSLDQWTDGVMLYRCSTSSQMRLHFFTPCLTHGSHSALRQTSFSSRVETLQVETRESEAQTCRVLLLFLCWKTSRTVRDTTLGGSPAPGKSRACRCRLQGYPTLSTGPSHRFEPTRHLPFLKADGAQQFHNSHTRQSYRIHHFLFLSHH